MEGVSLLEILIWVTLSAQIFLKLWSFFDVEFFVYMGMKIQDFISQKQNKVAII
jgi:hypothetical protein